MNLPIRLVLALVALSPLASACGPERKVPAQTTAPGDSANVRAPASAVPTPTEPPQQIPRSGASASPASACERLPPVACARTSGCILDQVTYSELLCRAAEDTCESSVRHADLIGSAADPAVTPEIMRAAVERCQSSRVCKATSGNCSCPCALLGDCDCACGGSFLPRCTLEPEIYEGRPPAMNESSPVAAWGKALVAVRRAPRDVPFKVDPLPDPALVVGKSRHEIESSLGTPTPCTGKALPSAPCQSGDQVFYSLYRLPRTMRGGGPELLVTYDDKRKAIRAVITHTR